MLHLKIEGLMGRRNILISKKLEIFGLHYKRKIILILKLRNVIVLWNCKTYITKQMPKTH